MTAAQIEHQYTELTDPPRSRPTPVPHSADTAHEAELRAEHNVFRDATIGAVIGALVCAPLWAAMVWVALRNSDQALLPPLAMAAGVGVLAGVFAGGWAGTLIGANALEKFERESRPKAPSIE